jgi:multisubunit Na+/H+ antiporter MnhC subunit
MTKDATSAVTHVRLAYASAVLLAVVGVFMLVRADERLQTVLGLSILVAGVAVAGVIRRGED